MIKIGFTGTSKRRQFTPEQGGALGDYLRRRGYGQDREFHFGDCVEADEKAFEIVKRLGGWRTVAHPPENPRLRAFCEADLVMPVADYKVRDRAIVEAADELVACPKGFHEEQRSGTWFTVREALRLGKPVKVIWPSGVIQPYVESPWVKDKGLFK